MRSGTLPLLVVAVLSPGCFAEPDPAASTGDGSTAAGPGTAGDDAETGELTATSDVADDSGTSGGGNETGATGGSTGSGSSGSTGGRPADGLRLFPLACTEADWMGPVGALDCDERGPGAELTTHRDYTLGELTLERVIDIQPVNAPSSPVDGYFTIDTSDFVSPQFRAGVGCVLDGGCQVDFLISAEQNGLAVTSRGGMVAAGAGVGEVVFDLPLDPELVIHINLDASVGVGGSRFLWVDPRVVDVAR